VRFSSTSRRPPNYTHQSKSFSFFCLPFACLVPRNQIIVTSPFKALNFNNPRDYSTDTQVGDGRHLLRTLLHLGYPRTRRDVPTSRRCGDSRFFTVKLSKLRTFKIDLKTVKILYNINLRLFKLLAPELFFFLILAHSVYKMWIKQEQNTLELWNKLHFEEKKKRTVYPVFKIFSTYICWINI